MKVNTTSWALRPLLLATALFSGSAVLAAETQPLNQAIAKGAYELAFSNSDNALFLATAQSASGEKGGTVYRLDPQDLAVKQTINTSLPTFGATINQKTNTLYFGNTRDAAVTAVEAGSGKEIKTLVLDSRKRSESVRPLQPRELVADATTDRVYITGLGQQSVVWVVDGKNLQLIGTVPNTGKMGTGLALDAAAQKLYVTNGDGELVTINTRLNAIEKRQKIDGDKDHFFLNIALDTKGHRAFLSDAKQPQVLVLDTRTQQVIHRIDVPESLAVLFNADRDELYVTHRKAGEISIIDASSYQLKRTVKAPGLPNSLALSADGKTLFVSIKQPGSRKEPPKNPDSVLRIAL